MNSLEEGGNSRPITDSLALELCEKTLAAEPLNGRIEALKVDAAVAIQRIANDPERVDSWTDDDIVVKLHFRAGPPKTYRVATKITIVASVVGVAQ